MGIGEYDKNYGYLIKGFSRKNVYEIRRDFTGDSKLAPVGISCGESKLNAKILVR